MLALIAGTGDLPPALVARLPERPLICALQGFDPALPVDIRFRLEHLGTFLQTLQDAGVTRICMAGAIRRPEIDPSAIDEGTKPLVPRVLAALGQGDDGALRIVISLLEEHGFEVLAAHVIAPDLLPGPGVLTKAPPLDQHRKDAQAGEACVAAMGTVDQGQACLIRRGQVVASEGADGTDAMIAAYAKGATPQGDDDFFGIVSDAATSAFDGLTSLMVGEPLDKSAGADTILFKAPKPDQDRRADLPVIGPGTAQGIVKSGLAGIVIEAGGVMVLEPEQVVSILDAGGAFLWVREKGAE
ncbi:UDP-2,3-diacylglucosamine diphosphatase LpxI [Cognatiyoonia sp. IB215446]|uniref:LpxI family protein n=1 Tax=Cognatiyoonia sp. IB215446 TaxID=3097355 RepID=UPI002A0DDFC5|nr:UDP-2,3-diacylglucosamine diphosphatase LpxI [Cognatiyoonia sp. IB215446]MDX8349056.1 UDP-2,3-diacylglucosamine diphosphatase LpxI [Cognatiyoonia sp. IB215446]